MNKIRNYWRNKKGITLVWGAFFLILCLMFLGLSADIAYMYVVKNQLQVAADAAALAGAAGLDPTDTTTLQSTARNNAWQFACKNTAADNPKNVFLVTAPANPNAPACDGSDTPPTLNHGNDPNGEFVI